MILYEPLVNPSVNKFGPPTADEGQRLKTQWCWTAHGGTPMNSREFKGGEESRWRASAGSS